MASDPLLVLPQPRQVCGAPRASKGEGNVLVFLTLHRLRGKKSIGLTFFLQKALTGEKNSRADVLL